MSLPVKQKPRVRSVADVTAPPPLVPPDSRDTIRDVVAEKLDSRMRRYWERVICREMDIPDTYQNVAVLILRWEKELDWDLGCEEEVNELDKLFRDDFKYESKVVTLHNRKRPQVQIDSAVSTFVEKHDGPHRCNLLIVYYTGHGFLRSSKGADCDSLVISGRETPSKDHEPGRYNPEARWDQAETCLNDAEADVLVILDCCFASSVMKNVNDYARSYELLAASGKDDPAVKPGPHSYTRALIDSLKEVLEQEEQRIYTFDLNQKIVKRRDWNTKPHVYNRLNSAMSRHILLAPLSKRERSLLQPIKRNAGHLTIQFAFEEQSNLDKKQVEALAKNISFAAKQSNLGICAIDWMGFEPYTGSKHFNRLVNTVLLLKKAMKRWKQRSRMVDKRRLEDYIDIDGPSAKRQRSLGESSTQQDFGPKIINLGPPTPKSDAQIKDDDIR